MYCNYSKDRFNKECTFIIPCWLDLEEQTLPSNDIPHMCIRGEICERNTATADFLMSLYLSESYYFDLLNKGWLAQQARGVLPNSLKTELVMTGTTKQWEDFFRLRCARNAHPQARELAQPLHEEFIKRGFISKD